MTPEKVLDPIVVLATGDMPASQGLDARFIVHNQPPGALVIPISIAASVKAIAASGPRRITEEVMVQLPNLEIVASFGVGVDRVDVEAASRFGIVVTNTPDVLTDEVADF